MLTGPGQALAAGGRDRAFLARLRHDPAIAHAEPAPAKAGVDIPLAVVDAVTLLARLRHDTATPVMLNVHADHLGRPVKMTNSAKAGNRDGRGHGAR